MERDENRVVTNFFTEKEIMLEKNHEISYI